jgi:hypothetical protein
MDAARSPADAAARDGEAELGATVRGRSRFIVPFDRRGRLRTGVTLSAAKPFQCYTLPDDRRWPYLWGCGGTRECFAPKIPARRGELLACPTQPGSGLFVRAAYRHL